SPGSRLPPKAAKNDELPHFELFGHLFSAYYNVDQEGLIRAASLQLRRSSDPSLSQIPRLFERIRESLVSTHGQAEAIDVPNFQDGTVLSGVLYTWKSTDRILSLEKLEFPGQITIRFQKWDLN